MMNRVRHQYHGSSIGRITIFGDKSRTICQSRKILFVLSNVFIELPPASGRVEFRSSGVRSSKCDGPFDALPVEWIEDIRAT